jgi:hypothetical protein
MGRKNKDDDRDEDEKVISESDEFSSFPSE